MLTLTIRHRLKKDEDGKTIPQDLKKLLGGLSDAWRRLTQGRAGQVARSMWTHSIRAVDVTFGPNGWHPHLHVLVFAPRDSQLDRDWIASRWAACVADVLGEDHRPETSTVGVHWNRCHRKADYLVHLGLELASDAKESSGGHSVWSVGRLAVSGDTVFGRPAVACWRDWVTATFRRRLLTWSTGCKRLVHEVPAEPTESSDEDQPLPLERFLVRVANGSWSLLVLPGAPLVVADILQWSANGSESLRAGLNAHGYDLEPDGQTEQPDSHTGEFLPYELFKIVYRRECQTILGLTSDKVDQSVSDETSDTASANWRTGPPI